MGTVDNIHRYRDPLSQVTAEVGVAGYSGQQSQLQITVIGVH